MPVHCDSYKPVCKHLREKYLMHNNKPLGFRLLDCPPRGQLAGLLGAHRIHNTLGARGLSQGSGNGLCEARTMLCNSWEISSLLSITYVSSLQTQQFAQLVKRQPCQFASMHHQTSRRLINASIAMFLCDLERFLWHTLLIGALWLNRRACVHISGVQRQHRYVLTSNLLMNQKSMFCWSLLPRLRCVTCMPLRLAHKIPELPSFPHRPVADLPATRNRQVKQHDLPFMQALHTMYVSVLAARKVQYQQSPKVFPRV